MSTLITTRAELEALQPEGDYKLANDIDLSSLPWVPLLFLEFPFIGTLDGDGHAIDGLTIIQTASNYNGLFAAVGDFAHTGLVKNLRLTHVLITISGYGENTAAFAGSNRGTILNCSVSGNIICGYQSALVAAYNDGLIEGCFAEGALTASSSYIGGIAGLQSTYGITRYCYSTAAVTGSSHVGGLLGRNSGGKVIRCYSTGKVVASSSVGGLVGSKNTTPPQYEDTGNFWDTVTSEQATSACGAGRITSLMRTLETFRLAGWNFDTIWQMPQASYPRLKWEIIPQNRIMPCQPIYEKQGYVHGQKVSVYVK